MAVKQGEVAVSPSTSVKIMRVWYCRCEGRDGRECEGVREGRRVEHQRARKEGRRVLREGRREGGSK